MRARWETGGCLSLARVASGPTIAGTASGPGEGETGGCNLAPVMGEKAKREKKKPSDSDLVADMDVESSMEVDNISEQVETHPPS